LLSDSEKKVADLYGAKGGMMGFIGAKRITYLIDERGKIIHVFDKVDTGNHSEQILDILKEKDKNIKEEVEPDTTLIE
jgi:peroxiredoxin Q/BCP